MKRILFALVIVAAFFTSCADMFRDPFWVRVVNRSDKAIDASFGIDFVNILPGDTTDFIYGGDIKCDAAYQLLIREHGQTAYIDFGEYEAQGKYNHSIIITGPNMGQYKAWVSLNSKH